MSRDTFYNQKFKCKCKDIKTKMVWLSAVYKEVCDVCNNLMKPVFEKEKDSAPNVIIASKHAKGRSPQERYKRRTDHFIKETLPTLGGRDKKYFEKKFGINKKTGKRTK